MNSSEVVQARPADGGKSVAIVQSSYVPWKGYFDLINFVDEFVLFDDRQFTRRDWRNRNRIKTPDGVKWLTIPVLIRGRYHQRIDETVVSDRNWGEKHWKTLCHCCGRAPFFRDLRDAFEPLYLSGKTTNLSQINREFIDVTCRILGISTRISRSSDYGAKGTKTERLISLCLATGATIYLSGPSARAYLDEQRFQDEGIELRYMDYDGYPEYPQQHPPFEHHVSILDLLFNVGADARCYMKSFGAALATDGR